MSGFVWFGKKKKIVKRAILLSSKMDFHSWDNYLHQTGSKGFLKSTAKKMRNMKLEFHHQLPPFINTRNKKYKIYQKKKKICQDSRGRAKQWKTWLSWESKSGCKWKKEKLASSKLGIRGTRGTYKKFELTSLLSEYLNPTNTTTA